MQHQKSSELIIYVAGGEVDIYPPFVGALHAPKAAVRIHGQGEIFGAVTGRTISNDGKLAVHFDRALPYLSRGPVVEFRLLGWDAGNSAPW